MKSTENKKREGRNKNGGFPCSMMCQKDSTIDFLNKIKGSLKNKRFKYCSFYVKKKSLSLLFLQSKQPYQLILTLILTVEYSLIVAHKGREQRYYVENKNHVFQRFQHDNCFENANFILPDCVSRLESGQRGSACVHLAARR